MASEREENARRILSALEAGVPFDAIFPRVKAPQRDPNEGRYAEFAAADQSSDGSPIRSYVLSCMHGRSELSLPDRTEDDDGTVLDHMLRAQRARTGCECWPRGWGLVEV